MRYSNEFFLGKRKQIFWHLFTHISILDSTYNPNKNVTSSELCFVYKSNKFFSYFIKSTTFKITIYTVLNIITVFVCACVYYFHSIIVLSCKEVIMHTNTFALIVIITIIIILFLYYILLLLLLLLLVLSCKQVSMHTNTFVMFVIITNIVSDNYIYRFLSIAVI